MCDCIKSMNEKLAVMNGRLTITFGFPHDAGLSQAYPTIEVEKIKPRGQRPPIALPTYCPFCGEKYPA